MVAADRIGAEVMGIDPETLGYLDWCEKAGVGTFEPRRHRGARRGGAKVQKKYRQHADLDRRVAVEGPLTELPPKLG